MEALTIQQGSRKAIVCGNLLWLKKTRNKKRDASMWPPTRIEHDGWRMYYAMRWVLEGCLDRQMGRM